MSELAGLLGKGGPVAFVVLGLLAIKYLVEAFRTYRSGSATDSASHTNDAATTNAMLVDSLRTERAGNEYLRRENNELRDDLDKARDELFTVKRDYEDQISALRRRLEDITRQLDGLQARLSNTPPPTH